jgi:hypothetical protein
MFFNKFPLDPCHVGVTSVAPKWFLHIWYIRRKSCTYLASRLVLPPNRLKRYSTWSTPPRSTIWCAQSDFRAYGTFGTNRATILPQDQYYIQTNRNELSLDQCHLEVPLDVPKKNSMPIVIRRKPCPYLTSRLILSPNDPKQASTWPMWPRST